MKTVLFLTGVLVVAGCTGGSSTVQANENAITIKNYAGGFGDEGASVAEAHCASYGKVAVFQSATGPNTHRKFTYLCT